MTILHNLSSRCCCCCRECCLVCACACPHTTVDAALAPKHTLLQCDTRLADSLARFTAEMTSSKADSGGRGFIVRCLNIVDPLLPTNNLGRSVVRSSFSRIRRAFGHGAALLRGMAFKVGVVVCGLWCWWLWLFWVQKGCVLGCCGLRIMSMWCEMATLF